jgi:hypothetical protein
VNAQAIQSTSIVVVVVIMVVVAAFRDNDAAAEYAAETHGHQHQRKDSFHNVPYLSVVHALYLERRLPVCLCVTRRVNLKHLPRPGPSWKSRPKAKYSV